MIGGGASPAAQPAGRDAIELLAREMWYADVLETGLVPADRADWDNDELLAETYDRWLADARAAARPAGDEYRHRGVAVRCGIPIATGRSANAQRWKLRRRRFPLGVQADAALIRATLDAGLQAWRTVPGASEKTLAALAALDRLVAGSAGNSRQRTGCQRRGESMTPRTSWRMQQGRGDLGCCGAHGQTVGPCAGETDPATERGINGGTDTSSASGRVAVPRSAPGTAGSE